MMYEVPSNRIKLVNKTPVNPDGDFVLYWMIAARRPNWNFSLDRALEWSVRLRKPVLVLEALRIGYKWACERFHGFALDGMKVNRLAFEKSNVSYYPYLEMAPDDGKGLIEELSKKACVIVTDNFPCFFLPRMVKSAARQSSVMVEMVDSNGILPVSLSQTAFPTAYSFRRFIQKVLPQIILQRPDTNPLDEAPDFGAVCVEKSIEQRWAPVPQSVFSSRASEFSNLPIDHKVKPTSTSGGYQSACEALRIFCSDKLNSYGELRNIPDFRVTSGLSSYLHWGHISVHQVFWSIMERENWTPDSLGTRADGKRQGWWGIGSNAESFLDELITWRELGLNMCVVREDYDQFCSLPEWAIKTLGDHEKDHRQYLYTAEQFEKAQTHDSLWNAAQTELVREGRMHNYLRMLWGKKILEWSHNPREALDIMLELNNKYGLDGRDPNSYSGIFWILGRYDRPWGPERKVFGKVRYMSSDRTKEKVSVKKYLEKYKPDE